MKGFLSVSVSVCVQVWRRGEKRKLALLKMVEMAHFLSWMRSQFVDEVFNTCTGLNGAVYGVILS